MTTQEMYSEVAAMARRGAQAATMTRRRLLTGTTLLLASLHVPKALAHTPSVAEAAFYTVSCILTDKRDLSPVTATRVLQALSADDLGFADKAIRLAALTKGDAAGAALKAAALAEGLEAEAMKIVSAWYTGTVETKQGPIVVAYKDALMYRPVADGLTVPTYCNKGPIWWTGLPPQISRMPVNVPKVL